MGRSTVVVDISVVRGKLHDDFIDAGLNVFSRKQALKDGTRPLRLAGAMKVAEGLTTVDEVLRTTPHLRG